MTQDLEKTLHFYVNEVKKVKSEHLVLGKALIPYLSKYVEKELLRILEINKKNPQKNRHIVCEGGEEVAKSSVKTEEERKI